VEVTRDIAIKFNEAYGTTFVLPEPRIRETVAVVPGTDGRKMSKSYGNTVDLFGDEKAVKAKVMSITMDSRSMEEPKPDAAENNAIKLLKLVAPEAVAAEIEGKLAAGGYGYGTLKKALFEQVWNYFATQRARRRELESNLDYVNQVLRDGAARARAVATVVNKRARIACGLE
jgi:tryptophanyl-tRNA synthetase